MAPVHNSTIPRGSSLQKIGRWRWTEHRPLTRRGSLRDGIELAVLAQLLLIFVVVIVFALGTFFVIVKVAILFSQTLSTTLCLHSTAQSLEMLALASPPFQFFLIASSFFSHFQDVAIGLLMLAVEGVVLLLQALGLLGHFFHFLSESQKQFIAVVQSVLDLPSLVSNCGQTHQILGLAYLLELLHVDVELATQLCFCVREGGDLSAQSSTPSNLILSKTALLLVLAAKTLDLGVPVTKETLEVHLTDVALLDDSLELVADPELRLVNNSVGRYKCGETYASSRSTSIFSFRVFPLAFMTS